MNNTPGNPHAGFSDDGHAPFWIRWRGRREGPYPAAVIEAKLAANQIGLLHEIFHNGQWVTLRDYLAEREATLRAERLAREEQERRAREEAEKRGSDQQTQATEIFLPLASETSGGKQYQNVAGQLFADSAVRLAIKCLLLLAAVCAGGYLVSSTLQSIRDTHDRSNPAIRDATKAAWKAMVDVEARRPSAEFPFGEWYMRRARQYADIELDGADTELQDHIKKTVEELVDLSKAFEAPDQHFREIATQAQQTSENLQAVSALLFGLFANNGRSVSENVAWGQLWGAAAGMAHNSVTLPDESELTSLYSTAIVRAKKTVRDLEQRKEKLRKRLIKKYNLQLHDI